MYSSLLSHVSFHLLHAPVIPKALVDPFACCGLAVCISWRRQPDPHAWDMYISTLHGSAGAEIKLQSPQVQASWYGLVSGASPQPNGSAALSTQQQQMLQSRQRARLGAHWGQSYGAQRCHRAPNLPLDCGLCCAYGPPSADLRGWALAGGGRRAAVAADTGQGCTAMALESVSIWPQERPARSPGKHLPAGPERLIVELLEGRGRLAYHTCFHSPPRPTPASQVHQTRPPPNAAGSRTRPAPTASLLAADRRPDVLSVTWGS